MGSPSGNFWLAFMVLAILQSDYFVLFAVCSQPEQITLFALRHSALCFSLLSELGHSNIQTSAWLKIPKLLITKSNSHTSSVMIFQAGRNCPTVSLERQASTHSLNTLPILPPPHRLLFRLIKKTLIRFSGYFMFEL